MSVVLTIQQRSFFLEQMEPPPQKKTTIGQNAKNNWLWSVQPLLIYLQPKPTFKVQGTSWKQGMEGL